VPWVTAATATTSASADAVWACYRDPATWAAWDDDVQGASIDGPFATGVTGSLRPAAGPPLRFLMERCDPGHGFDTLTLVPHRRLPLVRIRFRHELTPLAGGGCEIMHRVEMAGPLAALFARLMGPGFQRGLPHTVRRLAEYAAARTAPDHAR
jgi:hypothetical protein